MIEFDDLDKCGFDFEKTIYLFTIPSFLYLLKNSWSPNIPISISVEAIEILYAIVDHHMIMSLEGSPR